MVSYIVSEYSLVEVKKERLKTSMVQQTLLLIKVERDDLQGKNKVIKVYIVQKRKISEG